MLPTFRDLLINIENIVFKHNYFNGFVKICQYLLRIFYNFFDIFSNFIKKNQKIRVFGEKALNFAV